MRGERSRIALALTLCGSAAWLTVFCPAATPAAGATRIVTVHLTERGKGTWSTTGADANERLALTYGWRGTLTFAVPARPRFVVRSTATLTADWKGELSGTDRCRYFGANVPGRVTAELSNGTRRATLRLVLHAKDRRGFFLSTAKGASVSCTSPVAGGGPTHFEPAWLFRDNLQDHGRLTSDTAVIVVPSVLFPHGSVTVTFPHELGTVDQPLRPKLAWNNKGRLRLRAR